MTAPVLPRRTATGVLLILGSAVSFGAMAIFARIAYDSGADVHGVLLIRFGVAAAVIYTGYILAGSHPSGAAGPLASTTTVCLAAAGVYAGACLAHAPSFPGGLAGWSAAVATAVVSTLIAIIAFFAGLRLLGAAPSAAVSSAEPVVTSLLAFLVFAEGLSPLQIIGAALDCASVIGAAASSGRRATPARPPAPVAEDLPKRTGV